MTKRWTNGRVNFELFDERRVALQRELKYHPELVTLLQNHPVADFATRLAEIAAFCNVVMDGTYQNFELDHLCGTLYEKLKAKRGSIIVNSSAVAGKSDVIIH